jgi:hypothetical protein
MPPLVSNTPQLVAGDFLNLCLWRRADLGVHQAVDVKAIIGPNGAGVNLTTDDYAAIQANAYPTMLLYASGSVAPSVEIKTTVSGMCA